jgi:hypothetical protein
MKGMNVRTLLTTVASIVLLAGMKVVQADYDTPGPTAKKIDYSPYPEQTHPNRVYFGDTHLHTSYSADAGMVGNTLGPDEAYRFAKGEVVTSSTGLKTRLARPLDFLVVADHAENLGLAPLLMAKDPTLMSTDFGTALRAKIDAGDLPGAWEVWSKSKAAGRDPLAAHPDIYRTAWSRLT